MIVERTALASYLDSVVATLRDKGLAFGTGLSDAEIEAIEGRFSFRFPPDLRLFLQTALPLSPHFPNWRRPSEDALAAQLAWPIEGLCFDSEHNGWWLEVWGEKPPAPNEACRVARLRLAEVPRLIPIYGHRYLPTEPHLPGNPVFSVWQSDIIHYGCDLAGYFTLEFGLPLPDWAAHSPRPIRFWDNFL
jgi:hypothetical protein